MISFTHQNQLPKAIIMTTANFKPGCKIRKEKKNPQTDSM
jgi:hypothetical protein